LYTVVQKLIEPSTLKKFGEKVLLTAVLLCFFLGALGIHRFYLGYIWQGIVQLLTLGGFRIWALIDFIRILIGDLKPKNGEYEKTL
jgi:TM2 domain-containing membrane protein YozV